MVFYTGCEDDREAGKVDARPFEGITIDQAVSLRRKDDYRRLFFKNLRQQGQRQKHDGNLGDSWHEILTASLLMQPWYKQDAENDPRYDHDKAVA